MGICSLIIREQQHTLLQIKSFVTEEEREWTLGQVTSSLCHTPKSPIKFVLEKDELSLSYGLTYSLANDHIFSGAALFENFASTIQFLITTYWICESV